MADEAIAWPPNYRRLVSRISFGRASSLGLIASSLRKPTVPTSKPPLYIGIDVQIRRPCALVALDGNLEMRTSEWISGISRRELAHRIGARMDELARQHAVTIGIDAPRQGLTQKRPHYWDGKKKQWRNRRPSERGWGRHCEVVISGSGLANPQWTPPEGDSPDWMRHGYQLFQELTNRGHRVHEVFPSASYALLEDSQGPMVSIHFSSFQQGPKDMLDACVAAYTVHEYEADRGMAVGADQLGRIILPRALPPSVPGELLRWPSRD